MPNNLVMATRGKFNPTTNEICYLAGVLDSDGCISISKMKPGKQRTVNPRYVLTMNVVNTSLNLMHWLVEKFGGHFKPRSVRGPNHRTVYDWWFNNGKCIWILKLVEPFLIVKKQQALLGIDFIEHWVTIHVGPGSKTPVREVNRREHCFLAMKKLNRVGLRIAATTKSRGSCKVQQDDVIV